MKTQRIETYTEQEILNGKSHQEIYDHIVATSQLKIHDVAEIVRKIPTLEKRKKYKSLSMILLLILGLLIINRTMIIFSLINNNSPGSTLAAVSLLPVVSILLFYGVYKFKRNAYLVTGFAICFGMFFLLFRLVSEPDAFLIIDIVIMLLAAFIAFYLNVKLASDYQVDKEQQKNNPTQREGMIKFID